MLTNTDPSTRLRLAQDDIFSSLSYFEKSPTLAVAVSGGADSMALLLMAKKWADAKSGRVVALTVDHQLRKESAAEAKQVKKWCAARGIEHHTLVWNQPKKTQAAARDARYTLLTDWCKKNNVLHLFTAHHQGDQAETLLFRLARGSGIDGLACMAAKSIRNDVRLLRPLLGVPKQTLQDFLNQEKQSWIEDASNDTAQYTRNVIRAQLTPALGEQAAALAARMGVVRHHIEERLAEAMARTISIFPEGYALLDMKTFENLAPEYRIRMLAALTQTIGGEDMPPRTEKLVRLERDVRGKKTRTLGGCLFRYQPSKQRYIVKYERKSLKTGAFRPAKALAGRTFLELNSSYKMDGKR